MTAFPISNLDPHLANLRELADALAVNQTAINPIGGVVAPFGWDPHDPDWVPAVCDICGANVFTVNMGPHKQWHERNRG